MVVRKNFQSHSSFINDKRSRLKKDCVEIITVDSMEVAYNHDTRECYIIVEDFAFMVACSTSFEGIKQRMNRKATCEYLLNLYDRMGVNKKEVIDLLLSRYFPGIDENDLYNGKFKESSLIKLNVK